MESLINDVIRDHGLHGELRINRAPCDDSILVRYKPGPGPLFYFDSTLCMRDVAAESNGAFAVAVIHWCMQFPRVSP